MTPAERAFWVRANRRANTLAPEMARAVLHAFALLRAAMPGALLARLIAAGDVDGLIQAVLSDAILDSAFMPVRDRIRNILAETVRYTARDIPAAPVNRVVTVGFDVLNPRVVEAIQTLDTKMIQGLKDDVREGVRARISAGLANGESPSTIARDLRSVIGLSAKQEQTVQNFRALLEAGDSEALTRLLRNRRYDGTLRKAFGPDGTGLSASQIDTMVDAYRRRMIAHTAETNAGTAVRDSFKRGQWLAWGDAIDKGIVDEGRVRRTWVGVMDDRERPEHRDMEGETVGYNQRFSNGELIPGESTYNCRCIVRYSQS